MQAKSSLGIITSVDTSKQKIIATLQPSEYELGWLSSLFEVHAIQMGKECIVIPCEGSYGQSIVLPFPIRLPRLGTVTSASPLTFESDGKNYTSSDVRLMAGLVISVTDEGKTVLMTPVLNENIHVIEGFVT